MQDKYRIIDKIAAGGMAEVYLARSTAAMGLGKFVAIKRILPGYSAQPDFMEMFKTEAKIAMQLQHRNLVSIHDFGLDNGQCYLVMELIMGLTLRQILQSQYKIQKVIPIPMVLYIAAEVAAGLQYAHEFTIHRDVSPQNIMISFNGDVKVIDFGVAKSYLPEDVTQAGIIKGKLGYMSPEQIYCNPIDGRADVFSLGVVLYELLSQRRPFKGKTETEIVDEMMKDNVPWLSDVNPALDVDLASIVHRALCIKPEDRYENMDSFCREIRSYLSTNYPHFSSSDISLFMKREFAEEQQNFQEKLFGFTPPPTILKKTKPIEEITVTVPLIGLEEPVIPEDTVVPLKSSRVIRKRFHIRYAHQADASLRETYEMHSLNGLTKRGTIC